MNQDFSVSLYLLSLVIATLIVVGVIRLVLLFLMLDTYKEIRKDIEEVWAFLKSPRFLD